MPDVRVLAPGMAAGPVLVLDEPLSFWGGADPETGAIIDTHHPQLGESFAGRVLVMPGGRGSSSSSTVFAESIRNGVGPAAIVLGHADPILALGAFVADELYGRRVPVVVVTPTMWTRCASASGIRIEADDGEARIVLTG
jgi:uncharacterized protein